jgi:hypothetical protein
LTYETGRGQRFGKFARRREPIGRRFLERTRNCLLQRKRNIGSYHAEGRHGGRCMLIQNGLHGGTGERRRTRQHLVEHAAERVDVRPAVVLGRPGRLLGAHVSRRAKCQDGFGGPSIHHARIDGAGDAEVRDDGLPILKQDVLRLDIAMDDVLPVGVVQRDWVKARGWLYLEMNR